MPISTMRPSGLCLSQAARTAGTITAPACTGPPSKVSSKSSPCAAVPLTKAAPAAFSVRAWPIAVHGPSSSQPARDVVLVARGNAQADHIDQQVFALAGGCLRQATHPQRDDLVGERLGDGGLRQFGCHDRSGVGGSNAKD